MSRYVLLYKLIEYTVEQLIKDFSCIMKSKKGTVISILIAYRFFWDYCTEICRILGFKAEVLFARHQT